MREDLANLVKDLTEFNTDILNFKSECAQSIKRSLIRVNKDYFIKYVEAEPKFSEKYKTSGVYLAGLIELLCERSDLTNPTWINNDDYFLEKEFCSLTGFDREVPKYIRGSTYECFSRRNYFTNENGILV